MDEHVHVCHSTRLFDVLFSPFRFFYFSPRETAALVRAHKIPRDSASVFLKISETIPFVTGIFLCVCPYRHEYWATYNAFKTTWFIRSFVQRYAIIIHVSIPFSWFVLQSSLSSCRTIRDRISIKNENPFFFFLFFQMSYILEGSILYSIYHFFQDLIFFFFPATLTGEIWRDALPFSVCKKRSINRPSIYGGVKGGGGSRRKKNRERLLSA